MTAAPMASRRWVSIGLALGAALWCGVMSVSAANAADDEPDGKKDDAAAPVPAAAPASAGSDDDKPSTPPAPAPSLRVVKLQFRGNRKVEDDAIKINLKTAVGVTLTQEMLREDVRAIWKMGYFDDVQVEVTEGKDGSVVTFVLR